MHGHMHCAHMPHMAPLFWQPFLYKAAVMDDLLVYTPLYRVGCPPPALNRTAVGQHHPETVRCTNFNDGQYPRNVIGSEEGDR
jgi:hypothetical protein